MGGRDDTPDAPAARVIVLAAGGDALPAALLGVLSRKGLTARVVHDPPAVMAELAAGPARAVVVCRPARLAEAHDLAAAIARYHPGVARWAYDPGPPRARLGALNHGNGSAGAPPDVPRRYAVAATSAPPRSGEHADAGRDPEIRQASPATPTTPATRHADAVESATEHAAGPRLRLAGVDATADPAATTPAGDANVTPEQRRRLAGRTRRRLGALLGRATRRATAGPGQPTPAPASEAAAATQPLLTREEIDMLLGPVHGGGPSSAEPRAAGSER